MKKFLLFIVISILFLSLKLNAQISKHFNAPDELLRVSTVGDNINSLNTRYVFQDLKRATLMFYYPMDGNAETLDFDTTGDLISGTGTLINTVTNTFDDAAARKLFILTAAHVLEKNAKVNEEIEIWLTFDYETSHGNIQNNLNSPLDFGIRKVYKVNVIPRVIHGVKSTTSPVQPDIALLEVKLDSPSVTGNEAFSNAYAAGWDLHPKKPYSNISHPNTYHKQIYQDNLYTDVSGYQMSKLIEETFLDPGDDESSVVEINDVNLNAAELSQFTFYNTSGYWSNLNLPRRLYSGASGSGLINANNRIVAVLSEAEQNTSTFSAIENAWHPSFSITSFANATHEGFLMSFLDPNQTWISHSDGGYVNDLVQNNTSFDLNLTNAGVTKILSLNAEDFYKFKTSSASLREMYLGDGMLRSSSLPNLAVGQEIELDLKANNGDLLYKSTLQHDMPGFTTVFKGRETFPPESQGGFSSKDIKNNILEHLNVNDQFTSDFIYYLSNFQLENCTLSLKTNTGSSNVRAIKLPDQMPYNARELFQTVVDPNTGEVTYDPYANLWQSKKYLSMRGIDSENKHVEKIKVELKTFISTATKSGDDCIESEYEELVDIETSDNGGYLNLVNPNYSIKDVLASDSNCTNKNILRTTIDTPHNSGNKYYNAWVDYNKVTYPSNNIYILEDAITLNNNSTENPTTDDEITFHYEIPNENDLNDNFENTPNDIIKAQYRLGVANSALSPSIDNYNEGEIEDYLMEIRQIKDEDRYEAEAEKAKIVHRPYKRFKRGLPKNDDDINDNNQETPNSLFNNTSGSLSYFAGTSSAFANAAYVRAFGTKDFGSTPITNAFLLTPIGDVLSNNNPSNALIGNDNFEACPFPDGGDDGFDPNTILSVDSFDPENPATWLNWNNFINMWYNLQRIAMYINNPQSFPPIPIIDEIDWEVYNMFVNAYNNIVVFKNAIDNSLTFNDALLYFLENEDLQSYFLSEPEGQRLKALYYQITSYYCHLNSFGQASEAYEKGINIINNASRIALDFYGEVFTTPTPKRTIIQTIELGTLPTGNNLAVLLHLKGGDNYSMTKINSSGQIIHEIKHNNTVKSITSGDTYSEGHLLQIATVFDGNNIKLKINDSAMQSQVFSTNPVVLSYSNFTDVNNGSRWGANLRSLANTDYKSFNGELYEFLYFDEEKTEASLNELYAYNPYIAYATNKTATALDKNNSNTTLNTESASYQPDFAIYPNPAKDHINILVEVRQDGPVQIQLYDMHGRRVLSKNWPNVEPGHHMITLPNLNLTAGNYILKIRAGDVNRSEKVVIE